MKKNYDTEMRNGMTAMKRARQIARERAARHGVPLVMWKNGRIAYIDPVTDEEVPRPETSTEAKAAQA